ncbi:MAG TPA: hypothetical protein DEP66_00840 [Acidimicrobiaceae bacterium]|nr:hypothetical protein [Acidimicrobiaceae bacterium]HCB36786.1 hypothetical protein [Acidimicrobiaceae bacterium]
MNESATSTRAPRSPRPLAALLAAAAATLLCASVLVVAGPAGAANTAVEGLVDHDEDATTPKVRQYAGADRYSTALALARSFVEATNSDAVIVASGESLVDAAAAAGLAGAKVAPVVLTRTDRLPSAVARFIDDELLADVYVVGGESAVSAAVFEALEAIDSVDTVTRLAGPNRYATSVAIADEVGAPGEYCDTGQVAAILVNADSSFSDVIVAGPLASALALPLLLTPAEALPADVAGFLVDEEIERVVIVGGTAAVPEALEDELDAAGVIAVERISGDNRAATSIAVLNAIDGCNDGGVELSTTGVALVNESSPADGIAAAPLLGEGIYPDGGVTPALLVGTTLPAEVAAWLGSSPDRLDDGTWIDTTITAIGGTAVVSEEVMDAALAAATTSKPLTATVSFDAKNAPNVSVTFSEPVSSDGCDGTPADGSACNRDYYTVAGGPLLTGVDSVSYDTASRTARITLAEPGLLVAGTEITLAAGKVSGAGTDGRTVAAVDYTVAAAPQDNLRPRIRIIAAAGADQFAVRITEANPDDSLTLGDITLGDDKLSEHATAALFRTGATAKDYVVCLSGVAAAPDPVPDPAPAPKCEDDVPANFLSAGDVISIAKDAFTDVAGNTSRTTNVKVGSNNAQPKLTVASVTEPATVNAGSAAAPDYEVASTEVPNMLRISAKSDGVAGGAAGNDWYVTWVDLPAEKPTANPAPRATVDVYANRRTIVVSTDAEATVLTVLRALGANEAFAADFTATPLAADVGVVLTGYDITRRNPFSGGLSQVVLTLVYNDVLKSFECAGLIEANNGRKGFPLLGDNDHPDNAWSHPCVTGQELYSSEVAMTLVTDQLGGLPLSGATLVVPASAATSYRTDDPATADVVEGTSSAKEENRRLRSA